eukprot:UN12590
MFLLCIVGSVTFREGKHDGSTYMTIYEINSSICILLLILFFGLLDIDISIAIFQTFSFWFKFILLLGLFVARLYKFPITVDYFLWDAIENVVIYFLLP